MDSLVVLLCSCNLLVNTELEVTSLTEYTAKALNQTWQTLTLIIDETTQVRKVVLQNTITLDLLTPA